MWIQLQKECVKLMNKEKSMIIGNMEEGIKFRRKIKINTNRLFVKNKKIFFNGSMTAMKAKSNTNHIIKFIKDKVIMQIKCRH